MPKKMKKFVAPNEDVQMGKGSNMPGVASESPRKAFRKGKKGKKGHSY